MPNKKTVHEILPSLIAKAWKDDAFRKKFLANPKSILEKELGAPLPANMSIHLHEDTQSVVNIVIPRRAAGIDKLSEADLLSSVVDRISHPGLATDTTFHKPTSSSVQC